MVPVEAKDEEHKGQSERGRSGGGRWRTVTSWVLVVVASLLAVVSVVVVFGRNQLLNTDAYVNTVTPLASNPAIQTAVAHQVSTNLVQSTDIEDKIKNALPKKAGFLATPITNQVTNTTYALTLKLVQSAKFQQLWVTANRVSHKQLVNLLTGSSKGSLSLANGKVTIDLSQVEVQVKKSLDSQGITVFNRVPAVKGLDFVLFQSKSLSKIQSLVRFLNKLAFVLPVLTIVLLAGAVLLAKNRRRGLIRAAAGLALGMALILVAIAVARNQYLSGLSPDKSEEANAAVIDTVTATLRETVRVIGIVAAVIALLAIVAGVPRVKEWLAGGPRPDWMTGGPFHDFVVGHRKALQWSTVVLGSVILVIWSTPTTLVAVVVVLITLLFVGLIGLFAAQTAKPALAGATAGGGPGGEIGSGPSGSSSGVSSADNTPD